MRAGARGDTTPERIDDQELLGVNRVEQRQPEQLQVDAHVHIAAAAQAHSADLEGRDGGSGILSCWPDERHEKLVVTGTLRRGGEVSLIQQADNCAPLQGHCTLEVTRLFCNQSVHLILLKHEPAPGDAGARQARRRQLVFCISLLVRQGHTHRRLREGAENCREFTD